MTAHGKKRKSRCSKHPPTHTDNTLAPTHQRSCHVLASILTAELITCLTGPAASPSQLLGEGRTWEVWSSQLLAEGSRHTHRSFSPFYNLRSRTRTHAFLVCKTHALARAVPDAVCVDARRLKRVARSRVRVRGDSGGDYRCYHQRHCHQ